MFYRGDNEDEAAVVSNKACCFPVWRRGVARVPAMDETRHKQKQERTESHVLDLILPIAQFRPCEHGLPPF